MPSLRVTAVIPAAGRGRRLKIPEDKTFAEIKDRPIISFSLGILEESKKIDEVILIVGKDKVRKAKRDVVERFGFEKIVEVIEGGSTRTQSVHKGLLKVKRSMDIVLIHDGARPFISEEIIVRNIAAAVKFGAAITAIPVHYTIKEADTTLFISRTLKRDSLWEVQTPQTFRRDLILKAYEKAKDEGYEATDDACLVERLGHKVKIVEGTPENIKITYPADLIYGDTILNY